MAQQEFISEEYFENYTIAKAAIEARAIEVAELLSSIDYIRYPLQYWSREVSIEDDIVTIKSESGRSYDDPSHCSFDVSLLFQTNEDIVKQKAATEAKRQQEAEALAERKRLEAEATERRERLTLERLKQKYENG